MKSLVFVCIFAAKAECTKLPQMIIFKSAKLETDAMDKESNNCVIASSANTWMNTEFIASSANTWLNTEFIASSANTWLNTEFIVSSANTWMNTEFICVFCQHMDEYRVYLRLLPTHG